MRYLWANGVKFKVLGRAPTFVAHGVDSTAHVPAGALVKTILAEADHQYWMVVVPSSVGVDALALRRALRTNQLDLITDADIEKRILDCGRGELSPFGDLYGFPVIVEKSLTEQREIAFNAGSRSDFIVMKFDDYERMVRPMIAEFALPSLFAGVAPIKRNIQVANSPDSIPMPLKAARKVRAAASVSNHFQHAVEWGSPNEVLTRTINPDVKGSLQ